MKQICTLFCSLYQSRYSAKSITLKKHNGRFLIMIFSFNFVCVLFLVDLPIAPETTNILPTFCILPVSNPLIRSQPDGISSPAGTHSATATKCRFQLNLCCSLYQ